MLGPQSSGLCEKDTEDRFDPSDGTDRDISGGPQMGSQKSTVLLKAEKWLPVQRIVAKQGETELR